MEELKPLLDKAGAQKPKFIQPDVHVPAPELRNLSDVENELRSFIIDFNNRTAGIGTLNPGEARNLLLKFTPITALQALIDTLSFASKAELRGKLYTAVLACLSYPKTKEEAVLDAVGRAKLTEAQTKTYQQDRTQGWSPTKASIPPDKFAS